MKTFVEFLLHENLVAAPALAIALNEQLRHMKTAAEVVFENKLLTDDQYVRVLITQAQTGQTFQASCESEGVWSPTLASQIALHGQASCPSFADVLLVQGHFTPAELDAAAKQYHDHLNPAVASAPVPEVEMVQVAAAPSPVVTGLSSLLQEQILPKLEPYVHHQPWTQTQLKVVYHLLHQLVGIARFANAPTLEDLAQKTEAVFSTASASETVSAETLALCSNQIGLLVAVLKESVAPQPSASSSLDSFFDNLKTLEQRLQPQAA